MLKRRKVLALGALTVLFLVGVVLAWPLHYSQAADVGMSEGASQRLVIFEGFLRST